MSGKVEDVARAIEAESNYVISQHHAKALARRVIIEMREPTEAMMKAVDCAGEKRDWPSGKMHLAGWQAMIDEALK